MQCEQIRKYLKEYAAGGLPGYKAAWVAQHLGGCGDCARELRQVRAREPRGGEQQFPGQGDRGAGRRRQAPGEGQPPGGEAALPWAPAIPARRGIRAEKAGAAVRRPVPRRVRWLAALVALALAAGAAWLGLATLERSGLPWAEGLRGIGTIPVFRALLPHAGGGESGAAVPSVERVTAAGDLRYIRIRIAGADLLPPAKDGSWLTVYDDRWRKVAARVALVRIDSRSLTAEVAVPAPPEPTRYHIRIHRVDQVVPRRWQIELPPPPEEVREVGRPLGGGLKHVTLLRYGREGDWLHVDLSTGLDSAAVPELTLQDAGGLLLAPRVRRRVAYPAQSITQFRYRLPSPIDPPLRLVGTSHARKQLGPWTIPTGVVE